MMVRQLQAEVDSLSTATDTQLANAMVAADEAEAKAASPAKGGAASSSANGAPRLSRGSRWLAQMMMTLAHARLAGPRGGCPGICRRLLSLSRSPLSRSLSLSLSHCPRGVSTSTLRLHSASTLRCALWLSLHAGADSSNLRSIALQMKVTHLERKNRALRHRSMIHRVIQLQVLLPLPLGPFGPPLPPLSVGAHAPPSFSRCRPTTRCTL